MPCGDRCFPSRFMEPEAGPVRSTRAYVNGPSDQRYTFTRRLTGPPSSRAAHARRDFAVIRGAAPAAAPSNSAALRLRGRDPERPQRAHPD